MCLQKRSAGVENWMRKTDPKTDSFGGPKIGTAKIVDFAAARASSRLQPQGA